DLFRNAKLWKKDGFEELADAALQDTHLLSALTPQMLAIVGVSLSETVPAKAEGWLRTAQALYPRDFWINYEFANVLVIAQPARQAPYQPSDKRDPGTFRGLRFSFEHRGGVSPRRTAAELKRIQEGIGFYRVALTIRPQSAAAYLNLGSALQIQNDLP